ncbi:dihydrodipicolinate synthase family protein [Sporosarcina luteola]|uniref:dihydrodipicolinate synthase family protein n=1 Tax=Sporosarcina luteola TaxID=582850 RepID=UPI00203AD83E|nr:dihydrodipicolinate synthase family protein [Sporosarcina luteola]MCM3709142.1 dihydrodipicolinate synthase family protein [Sporosarcina luteola]
MNYADFARQLETINGIPITAFKEDTKEIDWEGVKENIEFLINNGLKVVVPSGNTSEFYAMTLEEAKETTKRIVEYVNGRAIVVVGIGYSVETAIDLGKHAADCGADAVMIHMPIHPYITKEGAIDYFKNIIEALPIPSLIYFKDPHVSDSVLAELAPLEKLVGVKYSVNDLPRFKKTVSDIPKEHNIAWICGTAEKWAPYFFHAGAKGFTSGLVNIYPEKSLELLNALQVNDLETVWKVWHEVLPFEDLRAKYNNGNNVVVIKEAMELVGLRAGVTREPVAALNAEDKEAIGQLIKQWGLQRSEEVLS